MGTTEYTVIIIIFYFFFILFIIATILYVLQYRKKKKEHLAMLNSQNEEHQKDLLSTQIEIQRETMEHIGREIHDSIGQKLILVSLYTQQLAYENKAPHINEAIENISKIINKSLSELREISKSLTDTTIHKNSISNLLEKECERINELKICQITSRFTKKKIELSYQAKSLLLRIVQEFLQNSIKHSNCKNILVTLEISSKNVLEIVLQDDGKGFDVNFDTATGIGLSNIKKRIEILGGTYQFKSQINNGTNLTIELLV